MKKSSKIILSLAFSILAIVVYALTSSSDEWTKKVVPAKGFSLGSAKLQPFQKRPTAKQLYNAALKHLDSLSSAAASEERHPTLSDGPADEPSKINLYHWAVKPDKEFTEMISGGYPLESIRNGSNAILYSPKKKTYQPDPFALKLLTGHSAAAEWAGLTVPPGGRSSTGDTYTGNKIISYRLLPDAKLDSGDTYVLQMGIRLGSVTLPPSKTGEEIRKIWLGKQDLLTRRIESYRTIKMGSKISHYKTITEFSGFITNPKLSPDLFVFKPPAGSKEWKPE